MKALKANLYFKKARKKRLVNPYAQSWTQIKSRALLHFQVTIDTKPDPCILVHKLKCGTVTR